MAYELPPIVKDAERLLVEIEQAVSRFNRAHRYALGADMRRQATDVLRHCNRAWRDRPRQLHWVRELVWAIDELKQSLQIGQKLRVFRSFAQFEVLIRNAESLGKQAGGWCRRLQQPHGQNPAPAKPAPERAKTLSARTASAYAGANP